MKGNHKASQDAISKSDLLRAKGQPDLDLVWKKIQDEAHQISKSERRLTALVEDIFISRSSFACSVAARLRASWHGRT